MTLGGVGNAEPRPALEGNCMVIDGSGINVGVGVKASGSPSAAGDAAVSAGVALAGTGGDAVKAGLGLD